MVNKKAQAQIITTVLIILLVLAAIIIIWQVVGGTVREGTEEIESQSSCLGLRIDITNIFKGTAEIPAVKDDDGNIIDPEVPEDPASITIRPTKGITGYQAYVDGVAFGDADVTGEKLIPALDTHTVFGEVITKGQEIEIIAKMGDAICPGVKQKVK